MENKIIKDFGIYALGIILIQGISFFFLPVYTRVFIPEQYGSLELINLFISILSLIIGFGIPQIIGIDYFRLAERERPKMIMRYMEVYLLLSFPFCTIMLLFFPWIKQIFLTSDIKYNLLIIAVFISFLTQFQSVFFTVLQSSRRAKELTLIKIFISGIAIIGNIFFVYYLNSGIEAVVYINLTSMIVTCVIISGYIYEGSEDYKCFFKVNKKYVCDTLAVGIPLMFIPLAAWVISGIDRWFINLYFTAKEVGIYSVSLKFSSIFQIVVMQAVSASYSPYIYEMIRDKGIKRVQYINNRFKMAFCLAAFFFSWIILNCSEHFFRYLVGQAYWEAYQFILFEIIGLIFLALTQYSTYTFYYYKKTSYILLIYVIGVITNILFNFLWIPSLAVWGAVYSTTCTYIAMFISATMLDWYYMKYVFFKEE